MKSSVEKLRVKKKITGINSLEAAICNVALFKTMKQKDFKDSIFISYNEDGVILQAQNEAEWNRANQYIGNFIKAKKIELLTFGYEREVYDNLINGDLKQYTKKLKDKGYDDPYPYINLIHYQRLRKSCQFMSKSKYNAPLAQWQKKNKQTPNFAYLVVQPRQRFQQVKRSILGMLKGNNTPIFHLQLQPKRFIHLYYNSQHSTILQSLYEKKQLEIRVEQDLIYFTLYGNIEIPEVCIHVDSYSKKLLKIKYQVIKQQQIRKSISLAGQLLRDNIFEVMDKQFSDKFQDNYCFIVCDPSQQKQLQKQLTMTIAKSTIDTESITKQIMKYKMCQFSEVMFVNNDIEESQQQSEDMFYDQQYEDEKSQKYHTLKIGLINGCQFFLQQFTIQTPEQLENFLTHIEQYQKSYNSNLLRLYGICNQYQTYYLILDYKTHSLQSMHTNGQLVDQIQVCHIILQILYTVNFLHTLEVPRCIGILKMKQIFVPGGMILTYLSDIDHYSIEEDVRIAGVLFKKLLINPNDQISHLISKMTEINLYDRINLEEAINKLQTIIG